MQNRTDLLRQLTDIKHQVEHAEIMIEAQRRIIASLTACGDDVTEAEKFLEALERPQDHRLDEIDRLLAELDKIALVTEEG
jgi:phosphate uptake regulator